MTKAASYQTIQQAFQNNGLVQWWKTPTQRYGTNEGQYGTEEGTDFALNLGTKIGSVTTGRVVYVGTGGYNDPSLGTIVQIQNSDGSVIHYQHLQSSNLKTGQTVLIGDTVGLSGGVRGTFSSGPHIEVRYARSYQGNRGIWQQQWIDSFPIIQQTIQSTTSSQNVGKGPGNNSGSSTTSSSTAASIPGSSFQFPTVSLAPTDDVTTVLWTIDELLQLIPFWYVPGLNDITIAGLDTGVPNPIGYVEGVFYNIGADFIAIVLRTMFFIIGALLLYKATNRFIDVGSIATAGVRLGASFFV